MFALGGSEQAIEFRFLLSGGMSYVVSSVHQARAKGVAVAEPLWSGVSGFGDQRAVGVVSGCGSGTVGSVYRRAVGEVSNQAKLILYSVP